MLGGSSLDTGLDSRVACAIWMSPVGGGNAFGDGCKNLEAFELTAVVVPAEEGSNPVAVKTLGA